MRCHNVTYPNTLHLDVHIYGLAQGCSNSIVLAMELPQPCAKPLTDHLSMGWCKGETTLIFIGLQLHIFTTYRGSVLFWNHEYRNSDYDYQNGHC